MVPALRKGRTDLMTGSVLVPVFIPVVIVALAAWLALVYYADAHPGYRTRKTVGESGAVHTETAPATVRPDGKASQDGDDAGEEREREAATRRAA
jgi:hypothetical protein